MNDDAFARRFYADRAELEALGIDLKVEKPPRATSRRSSTRCRPRTSTCPPIEFTDGELAALQTLAVAARRRVRLRRAAAARAPAAVVGPALARSRAPEQRSVALAVTASAGGRELSQRLAKVETAISRRKTIVFDYYTIERDAPRARKVDPYHLLYRAASSTSSATRTSARTCACSASRASATRCATRARPSTTSAPPEDFDPRVYATRADWQLGDSEATAQVWISSASPGWSSATSATPAARFRRADGAGVVFTTEYADSRAARVLGAGSGRARAPPRAAGAGRRDRRAPRADHRSATPPVRRWRPPPGRRPSPPRSRTPTAGARRRSAPSASPAWSRSPAS